MNVLVEVVRCKDCIHRPIVHNGIWPPNDDDETCPCICPNNYDYNYVPADNFFCARGEPNFSYHKGE